MPWIGNRGRREIPCRAMTARLRSPVALPSVIALGLASGCAHGSGTAPVAATPACSITVADVEAAPLDSAPGGRVSIPSLDDLSLFRGAIVFAHPCGLVIAVVEPPSVLSAEERARFGVEALDEMERDSVARNMRCEASGEGQVRCEGAGTTTRLQIVDGAVVSVSGDVVPEVADAILRRARLSRQTEYDAVELTGLDIETPRGLRLDPRSPAGLLTYLQPGATDRRADDGVQLIWRFQAYEVRDGAIVRPTDHEMGEAVGRAALTELGVTPMAGPAEDAEALLDGDGVRLVMRGTRNQVPTLLAIACLRDSLGFFFAVAAFPETQRERWQPRFAEHFRSAGLAE